MKKFLIPRGIHLFSLLVSGLNIYCQVRFNDDGEKKVRLFWNHGVCMEIVPSIGDNCTIVDIRKGIPFEILSITRETPFEVLEDLDYE